MRNKSSLQSLHIISFLFLLSGFSALAYEVVWFKRFSHIWGSSTLSHAAVVSTFLFGLALGAMLLGRLADRVRSPIGWYCLFELLIALFAFLIPYEMQLLRWIASLAYPIVETHPAVQTSFRFLLTFLVIGPPCVLMGGTLPMLMRNFLVNHPWKHETTGWLYAINTIGAAFGCYVTGFHLLPSLGIIQTNWVAIFINLDVALIAYLLMREYKKKEISEKEQGEIQFEPVQLQPLEDAISSPTLIYPAAAMTGCASLILQMVWTRKLAVMLGGTTYVFSAILFVFLLGIGIGSLIYSRSVYKIKSISRVLTLVILVLIATVAIGNLAIPYMSMAVGAARYLRSNMMLNAVISVTASSVLQLIPTICMGFLFPLFVDLMRGKSERVGTVVGDIYTWNTMGSIIGVWIAPFILIVYWGTSYSIAIAMGLYLLVLLILHPYSDARKVYRAAPALILACILIWVTSKPLNPLRTDMGMYLDGYLSAKEIDDFTKLLLFEEGAMANVLVVNSEGNINLRVNGKVDASDTGDMSMQLGLSYIPHFLRPESKEVLVIGYGSGTTAGASLLFPDTQVTCCEIEPAIVQASDYFAHVNHRPTSSERFNMVLDDGRSYLEGSRKKYDLILSEPSNPWMAGISNLFTLEFYQQVREHMQEDGIFTQWIHTYTISSSEYFTIVRTLLEVFPHAGLIRISSGDTLLLASMSPIAPSLETLQKSQSIVESLPRVKQDLERYFRTADVRTILMQTYLLPEEGVRRLVEKNDETILNTDLNMWLEFNAPLYIFIPDTRLEKMDEVLLRDADPNWWIRCFEEWECSDEQAVALKLWIQLISDPEKKKILLDFALPKIPNDPSLLAEQLEISVNEPSQFVQTLNRLVPLSIELAFQAGTDLIQKKDFIAAAEVFKKVVEAKPSYTSAWVYLGQCYGAQKQWDLAEETFAHASSLDPSHPILKQIYREYQQQKASHASKSTGSTVF